MDPAAVTTVNSSVDVAVRSGDGGGEVSRALEGDRELGGGEVKRADEGEREFERERELEVERLPDGGGDVKRLEEGDRVVILSVRAGDRDAAREDDRGGFILDDILAGFSEMGSVAGQL